MNLAVHPHILYIESVKSARRETVIFSKESFFFFFFFFGWGRGLLPYSHLFPFFLNTIFVFVSIRNYNINNWKI